MTELSRLPASKLRRLMDTDELSPTALVEASLEQIERRNETLNAVVTVSDTALDEARALERNVSTGGMRGPLYGLPVGIKDVTRRDADDLRLSALRRQRTRRRRAHREAPARGGRDHPRQDEYSRVRGRRQHVQRGVRPDAESVGYGAQRRGIDGRRGGRACDRHGRDRRRHRPRGLAAHPGVILRHCRPAALAGARAHVSDPVSVGRPPGDGNHGPNGRGHRHGSRRRARAPCHRPCSR